MHWKSEFAAGWVHKHCQTPSTGSASTAGAAKTPTNRIGARSVRKRRRMEQSSPNIARGGPRSERRASMRRFGSRRHGRSFLASRTRLRPDGPQKAGAPEKIRTPDPQIRSLVLYPTELRARWATRRGAAPQYRLRSGRTLLKSTSGRKVANGRWSAGPKQDRRQNSPPFQRIAGTSGLSLVGAFAKIAAGFWGRSQKPTLRCARFVAIGCEYIENIYWLPVCFTSRLGPPKPTNTPWRWCHTHEPDFTTCTSGGSVPAGWLLIRNRRHLPWIAGRRGRARSSRGGSVPADRDAGAHTDRAAGVGDQHLRAA